MFDKGKVIAGIVIFFVILLIPFWYNAVTGKAGYAPELKPGTDAKECVEKTSFMKEKHTELLTKWKEAVVRNGEREYRASNGKTYVMSLTGTCMGCHTNKEQFCDRCHNYTNVKPYCWDCHNVPKVVKK
ncbi:MAG: hypothetical protein A4E64_01745 [Syntrophorhabdus sp. PtaU1.Bin058]|nr:MAG: hypothetical protein A4E64_01745 [Syntrophorhabdus sp. PtaU1.Bin058]